MISTYKEKCPFCGNEQEDEFAFGSEHKYGTIRECWHFVMCSCGAQGPFAETTVEAIQRWNRRPE